MPVQLNAVPSHFFSIGTIVQLYYFVRPAILKKDFLQRPNILQSCDFFHKIVLVMSTTDFIMSFTPLQLMDSECGHPETHSVNTLAFWCSGGHLFMKTMI